MTATWFGFALIGDSWFQLLIAAALGIMCTQLSFLAHEAGHRQIFASRRANDWAARLLATSVAGMSYSWWEQKHGAHHNHPNVISKDPDIRTNALVFHDRSGSRPEGPVRFPHPQAGLVLLPAAVPGGPEPADRFASSSSSAATRSRTAGLNSPSCWPRLSALPVLAFTFLPSGMALAFIGVQLVVFGFYMGASFAPNHKGMPVLPARTAAWTSSAARS